MTRRSPVRSSDPWPPSPSVDEETAVIKIAHFDAARVVVGVDTHKDEHVAVAINGLGTHLGEHNCRVTLAGYEDLERWAVGLGNVVSFGVEGTGSFGAGLARFLSGQGHTVIEVNRPDRSTRRRVGKSDPIDAEAAARSVLAGVATGVPKSGTHGVEMIRMLKVAKDSAMKARTQATNQVKALVLTAPTELRQALDGLSASRLIRRCAGFRRGDVVTPMAAARLALRSLARRHQQLTAELKVINAELTNITAKIAPALLQAFCVGPDSAAALLISAGDNPERLKSESAFAALCGVSPIPASSGKTNRHRLNRGGDRRANSALHRVVIVRLRHDERTRNYMVRRTTEGMTKMQVIRCLKRYLAREVYAILRSQSQQDLIQVA